MLKLSKLTCGNPRQPPLIFFHGFLVSKEDWEGMLPFFQDRFFCIAYDLPGHGQSPYSEEILKTIKKAVKTVEEFDRTFFSVLNNKTQAFNGQLVTLLDRNKQ